jgi:polar amino acid transport system substrate-binding protein
MVWTRRQLLRGSAGLGVMAASGGLLTACAEAVAGDPHPAADARPAPRTSTSTRPPTPTTITVLVVQGEPYAFTDKASGELTGQTVEVAKLVLKRAGVDNVKFVITPYDLILTKLAAGAAAGTFDMAGGLYLNKSVCQAHLTWSVIDHVGLTALAVPPGNPKHFKTFADVITGGATVAVMRDLPEQQYATKVGVPAAKLKVFPAPVEMLHAVTGGQADCAAFSDLGLRTMVKDGLAKVDVTTGFPLAGEPPVASAFAFPKTAKRTLVEAFNSELTKLQQSGEWLRIAAPFGFGQENLPQAGTSTDQVCAAN